jgi:hypothetical protein
LEGERMNRLGLLLILGGAPALSGCVPMMAASAVSMAAQAGQGHAASNATFQPTAREACTARAAQLGTVHIIDVEQHQVDEIIVWGTVDDGKAKRSFECDFGTQISAFKLREIHPEK